MTTPPAPSVTVQLVDYPLFDDSVVTPDQAMLDAMAAEYVATLDGATPEMERFLFGSAPVQVFDRIFAGETGDDIGGLLWVMHLSGYFGGRWLRGEIGAAQPEAPLVGFSQAPTAEGFAGTMARADAALAAATGDDAAALAYARASLFDEPPATEGGQPVRGLTDSFGYNEGYMLQILEAPPEGLTAGDAYQISCAGLFDCSYATPRFAVLDELADVQAQLSGGQGPYAELYAELIAIQEAAIPRGRGVWSSGLSVQGFPQAEYDQLLDVSSSFLETVQATGLTMAQASVTADAEQARVGALANAVMIVWLASYIDGLINGEGTIELPSFVQS